MGCCFSYDTKCIMESEKKFSPQKKVKESVMSIKSEAETEGGFRFSTGGSFLKKSRKAL